MVTDRRGKESDGPRAALRRSREVAHAPKLDAVVVLVRVDLDLAALERPSSAMRRKRRHTLPSPSETPSELSATLTCRPPTLNGLARA